ncbi:MAG: SAM-dependent chlorinase/fluorinase [Acidobacteriota bacterium]|nr:SAM-dependent chlorinase/fluorinase [Acidobacteriota bacterium]
MSVLTLLTDFGTRDYYVAAMKGVVLRLAPPERRAADGPLQMVDISHEIGFGEIAEGAFVLAAAAASFPAGTVHLAVVDPGVGSDRRILVVENQGAVFVGPDNGLLHFALTQPLTRPLSKPIAGSKSCDEESAPELADSGALDNRQVFAVERSDLYLSSPGSTFHGRDRFAPVAAAVLRGETLQELGSPISDPVLLPGEAPKRTSQCLEGRVIHIDRFGNLVTDLPSAWLGEPPAEAKVDGHPIPAWVSRYDQLGTGEAGLLPGSLGTLEVSLRGESLAQSWKIHRGAPVRIALR